jgi:predicted nucleotidyltransferase
MDITRLVEEELLNLDREKQDIDLSSFKSRNKLDPKIWDENQKLRPEIRRRLLMIADDFFETLDIPWVDIDDVTLTGSLANYNWSKYSDVDLHIIIPYNEIDKNEELTKEYLLSKKSLWNNEHDITIRGYDVEIYPQNSEEEHISSGVYSIMWDDWLVKPQKGKRFIDAKKVKQKVYSAIEAIDDMYRMFFETGEYDKLIRRIQTLKAKIKKMRQTGLDREGEYSYENIAFKVLRRSGYLERLSDLETKSYDKSLSL